jgi:hypothetical protein
MALGVLAVLFGVSALFVDYGDLWQRFVDTVRPTNAEEIEVDATDLYDMLALGKKEAKGGALLVEVEAGESFPTDTNLQQVWQAAEGDPRRQLAVEALLRGYVRVEYFGEEDGEEKFLYDSHVRVADLEEDEDALLKLPLPRRNRLHRVRLTY